MPRGGCVDVILLRAACSRHFVIRQFPLEHCWPPHQERARRKFLLLGHERPRSHDRVFADFRAIEQERAHPDQDAVVNRAAMQDGRMADRYLVADGGAVRAAHHVNHRVVLDVGAAANPDGVHVAPDHDVHPDTALLTDFHVPDDLGTLIDEGALMDLGENGPERPKHADGIITCRALGSGLWTLGRARVGRLQKATRRRA
jgi:hypothetical protein